MSDTAETKRFSIRRKLTIIFGLLLSAVLIGEIIFAISTMRKTVTGRIQTHLTDKAADVEEIIDGRIRAWFQLIEGMARIPDLIDSSVSLSEKLRILEREAMHNPKIMEMSITDMNGYRRTFSGKTAFVGDREWFLQAQSGKPFISDPLISRASNKFVIAIAVPLRNERNVIVGVLGCTVLGTSLSDIIDDIVVGKTGNCYILGPTGASIADEDAELVITMSNAFEEAKTDPAMVSIGMFEHDAVASKVPITGLYTYKDVSKVAASAKMRSADWTVVINAPYEEFMSEVKSLSISLFVIGVLILITVFIIVYFVTTQIVKPVRLATSALKDIAQGEGDLTVRLPENGNDEVTDVCEYFNKTIEKIAASIRTVDKNSYTMTDIGNDLASNTTQTASSVHQISANIEGVKEQAMTQSTSVTETSATIEEIIRTIRQLNNSIQNQAASVTQSSASVEEMVSNIMAVGHTLDKTDDAIKKLASATDEGKNTLIAANEVAQKISEESGSLMEASSVIQRIASQTNLLAMNAAIEAAHAGEAGKGFAVVADEIRKLAEDSATQGKSITTTLKDLSAEIETLSVSSGTVGENFTAIFNLTEQVKEMSGRLTEAMKEQENGSKEVLSAMRDINSVTTEVQTGSEEMLKGGESVAREMRKLDDLTRIITDSMNEMASGAAEINKSVQEVNTLTQKNKYSIDNLAAEVRKFKI